MHPRISPLTSLLTSPPTYPLKHPHISASIRPPYPYPPPPLRWNKTICSAEWLYASVAAGRALREEAYPPPRDPGAYRWVDG